jgi:hypothetical protein
MLLGISPQVLRAFWPGFALPVAWIWGLLIFLLLGKGDRRKLCIIWLRVLPVFVVCTAYILWIVWLLSNHPI